MFPDLPPEPAAFIEAIPEVSRSTAIRAEAALMCARANGQQVDKFIVFDAGRNAEDKRLFVLDVRDKPKLVLTDWVAHGAGSDPDRDGLATKFSNTPNSLATSLGLYRIAERYQGKNPGSSYRLDGLTSQFNTNARDRAVVVHTSTYVRPGHVGRSWGCPALRPEVMQELDRMGMKNTMLWIDAEGQGLEESASLSCPVAQQFIAKQELYEAKEHALAVALVEVEQWMAPKVSMAASPQWGEDPALAAICVA